MTRFEKLLVLLSTLPNLGILNILRVIGYRLKIAVNLGPIAPKKTCPRDLLFPVSINRETSLRPITLLLFGWLPHQIEDVPDWHTNPTNLNDHVDSNLMWQNALNKMRGRDVKLFWELSRFGWLPQFAFAARSGNTTVLHRINIWVADWIHHNPPYMGINWSCGQEAAMRVINLAMTQIILGNHSPPSSSLAWLVEISAQRIRPTLSYALGQDNNHGSAEACALFIAGTWGFSWNMSHADDIAALGLHWLQDRILRLIQSDGSPSQYSTNYHRANLETFCVAELWRLHVRGAPFKAEVIQRISDGARWLHHITDLGNGDAPNFGANDGSHIFNCQQASYRDFRPTVALAARLFGNANAYKDINYEDPRLSFFKLPAVNHNWACRTGHTYDQGGFHVLKNGTILAVMRYPRFHFRPSHADALHLDLWVDGDNLLHDAGTYSYSAESHWLNYFSGTCSHNTVQFDDRDQMPRISRFLFGNWLKTSTVKPVNNYGDSSEFGASYIDHKGAYHERTVTVSKDHILVVDKVSGFAKKGILRWHLMPGDWFIKLSNGAIICRSDFHKIRYKKSTSLNCFVHTLTVRATMPVVRFEIIEGWESRYYLQKTSTPVLEVEFNQSGVLTTEYRWGT